MRHPLRRKYLSPRLLPLYALGLLWLWLAEPTPASLAAGGLVAASGAALRAWGAGHLVKTDRMVVTGPYAYLRHPLYAGTLLATQGLALAAGRVSLALVTAAFVPFFLLHYLPRKDRTEGARLERRHGRAYADWRRSVPALLPRLTPWRPAAGASQATCSRWNAARFGANDEGGAALAIVIGWLLLLLRRAAT